MSDKLAEFKKEKQRLSGDVKDIFKTEKGQKVLGYLRAKYMDGDLFSEEPLKMAASVAQRDVVRDIVDLLEMENDEV